MNVLGFRHVLQDFRLSTIEIDPIRLHLDYGLSAAEALLHDFPRLPLQLLEFYACQCVTRLESSQTDDGSAVFF